jgi:hypothetical protein
MAITCILLKIPVDPAIGVMYSILTMIADHIVFTPVANRKLPNLRVAVLYGQEVGYCYQPEDQPDVWRSYARIDTRVYFLYKTYNVNDAMEAIKLAVYK